MFLTTQQLNFLDEFKLRAFLELRIPEGLYLDYKVALSGTSDKDSKREFLKDVTAFANAAGGQIVLGAKEPADGQSVEEALVGIECAEAIAQDLERLCSTSIDPRIPGLGFFRVSLASGKSCLIINVPPSLSRPHMVDHAGHRSFYVRHYESSFPMTTHELREAVLQSASAELRTQQRVIDRVNKLRSEIGPSKPTILLQAAPLIALATKWDVFSQKFEDTIRSGASGKVLHSYANLSTSLAPRPTIYGLRTQNDRNEPPTWKLDVHRDGYLALTYADIQIIQTNDIDKVKRPVVHSGTCDVFRGFSYVLGNLLEITGSDGPYLLSAHFLNAQGTCLCTEKPFTRFTEPYPDQEIAWPDHFRATGGDLLAIADSQGLELFHAFGFKAIEK